MKTVYKLLSIILLATIIFGSCKKDKKPGTLSVFARSGADFGNINLYIDGSLEGTIYYFDYLSNTPSCGSPENINLTFPAAGNYAFKAIGADGSEWQRTVYVAEDNNCQQIELNQGNRTKVPPPPSSTGDIVFWENSTTGCSATTDVTIGGVTKHISLFSSSVPACGSIGNATFTLEEGTYSYSASCSGTVKTGTVIVIANQCESVQLNWSPSQPGEGQVVFWESSGTGCSGITDVVINGVTRQISVFSASIPSCGSNGNATFSLPSGTYSYTANCSGTTKSGTVTITSGQCLPVQLNWGGGNTSGYNCSNGNCVFVSNNAQYASLSACQNDCSQISGSTITFVNNASTPIDITFGGVSKVAPVGGNAVFTGTPGLSQSGTAQTSGKTSTGTTVGNILNWNLNYQFPVSGNSTINLNVGSDYFFIKLRNEGSKPLINFYVNYGLQSQTLDNITIPNDNQIYNIGYYKAWTNSNVRADLQGANQYISWYQGQQFTLPFTVNQVASLYNNHLIEIEFTDK